MELFYCNIIDRVLTRIESSSLRNRGETRGLVSGLPGEPELVGQMVGQAPAGSFVGLGTQVVVELGQAEQVAEQLAVDRISHPEDLSVAVVKRQEPRQVGREPPFAAPGIAGVAGQSAAEPELGPDTAVLRVSSEAVVPVVGQRIKIAAMAQVVDKCSGAAVHGVLALVPGTSSSPWSRTCWYEEDPRMARFD